MIRVVIPHHLRNLAGTGAEVAVAVEGPVAPPTALN